MARTSGEELAGGEKRRGGLTARSILHAVKRRPLTLLGVALLACGVGASVWFFLPLPKSTAAGVFHVASTQPSLLGSTGGGDGNSYRQSQATLIKRRMLLNAVLKQPAIQSLEVVRKQPDPMAWLEHNLKAEVRPNNDFMRVSLEGDNGEELRIILDALTKAYLADVDQRDNGARRERLQKLEESRRRYADEVEQFHKRIDTIALALGSQDATFLAVNDSIARDNLLAAIRELSDARNSLEAVNLGLPAESDAATAIHPWRNPGERPVAEVTPGEVETELRLDPQYRDLETKVGHERQILLETKGLFQPGARPPAVVQAEEKYEAAQKQLGEYRAKREPEIKATIQKRNEEKRRAGVAAALTERGKLEAKTKLARTKVEDIQKSIGKASEFRVELDKIKRLIGQTEELSATLTKTIETLKLDLGAPQRVTLADEPFVVAGLEGNRRLKFTLLAAVAVLVVGFASVVGWEHRARRLTHADEVPAALGARLLGSVPVLGASKEKAGEPHPVLVEAIDATRTMLVHGSDHPDLRVLVVTSAVSGEGKTSLSGHLAISLARAGFRTLLIDGDLRAPTAQRVFDVPLGPGLCELLEGRAGVGDAVRPTGFPGLSVLTAGVWTTATRQALVGDQWRILKEQLKADFDYVIVDTSPLLLVSDALLLAREADGVVVSVLLGVSQITLVVEAIDRLQAVRAKFTGVIANGARHAAHQYAHGYNTGRPQVAATSTGTGV